MKRSVTAVLALAAALLARGATAAPAVTGDYVESRSANVYVGACHHEGEVPTAGRQALLAWNVTDGAYRGVSLKGVTAVAVVAADRNLELDGAKRQSVLYIADSATPEQREAIAALLKERAAAALGEVVAVRSAPITFDASGDLYRVQVAGVAYMKIRKEPGQLCCKQPYEVWGKPFIPVRAAKPGYCIGAGYREASLSKAWAATDQNNAFFGTFAL